jgi:integrase
VPEWEMQGRLKKHFFPKFGSRRVIDLTQTEIGNWHASLTKTSDDDEVVRRSKDSANRVLTMVKAFLNDAWQDKKNNISNSDARRNVKPFRNVSRAREVRYSPAQAQLLIASCADEQFADLVRGAYLTGARYGELNSARKQTELQNVRPLLRLKQPPSGFQHFRTVSYQESRIHPIIGAKSPLTLRKQVEASKHQVDAGAPMSKHGRKFCDGSKQFSSSCL